MSNQNINISSALAQRWQFQLRVCDATGTAILSADRPAASPSLPHSRNPTSWSLLLTTVRAGGNAHVVVDNVERGSYPST